MNRRIRKKLARPLTVLVNHTTGRRTVRRNDTFPAMKPGHWYSLTWYHPAKSAPATPPDTGTP